MAIPNAVTLVAASALQLIYAHLLPSHQPPQLVECLTLLFAHVCILPSAKLVEPASNIPELWIG